MGGAMDHRDEAVVVQAAWMYYEDGMTHAQIAEQLKVSRPTVTRLLQTALDKGIVQIKVVRPVPEAYKVQRELEACFGLKDSVIFYTPKDHLMMYQELAWAIVDYFRRNVKDGDVVGFGWALSFNRVPDYLRWLDELPACRIVHLMGNFVGPNRPFAVAAAVAEAVKGQFYPLYAPVLLNSKETLSAFMSEPSIQQALELARQCDMAFFNVGNTLDHNTLVQYSAFTSEDMSAFRQRGLVGDALLRYYDVQGNHIPLEMNERVIGINWDDLSRIPHLVLATWGQHKVKAILGMLRSGLCHTLITDIQTARAVIELHKGT